MTNRWHWLHVYKVEWNSDLIESFVTSALNPEVNHRVGQGSSKIKLQRQVIHSLGNSQKILQINNKLTPNKKKSAKSWKAISGEHWELLSESLPLRQTCLLQMHWWPFLSRKMAASLSPLLQVKLGENADKSRSLLVFPKLLNSSKNSYGIQT